MYIQMSGGDFGVGCSVIGTWNVVVMSDDGLEQKQG